MMTLIPCGGAPRTEDNNYGVRWYGDRLWFMSRAQQVVSTGARVVIWHQPGGWRNGPGRKPQQGARHIEALPKSFYEAVSWLAWQGVESLVYLSCETETADGFSPIQRTHADLERFRAEWAWAKRWGIRGFFRDRGAHPTNFESMLQVRELTDVFEGVEAVPRESDGTLHDHVTTFSVPLLCRDAFAAKRWNRAKDWRVYGSHNCVIDNGDGALTEPQWAVMLANGWERVPSIGPGFEASE